MRHLHFYTNPERTRTFIALKVDNMHYDKVHKLMEKVDAVMTEYRLQSFYEVSGYLMENAYNNQGTLVGTVISY